MREVVQGKGFVYLSALSIEYFARGPDMLNGFTDCVSAERKCASRGELQVVELGVVVVAVVAHPAALAGMVAQGLAVTHRVQFVETGKW